MKKIKTLFKDKLLQTLKYIIQIINVLILEEKKERFLEFNLILLDMVELPYKLEAKWNGVQDPSSGHSSLQVRR